MGNLIGGFSNSKVAKKVLTDSSGKGMLKGDNSSTSGVGLSSKSKHTTNPTEGTPQTYGTANGGGASGDGPTPGYSAAGAGVSELNNAHGNDAKRKLSYGN